MVNVIKSEDDYNIFSRAFSNSFTTNLTDSNIEIEPITETEKMEILMSESENKKRKKNNLFNKDNYLDILEFVGLKKMKKVI